MVWYRVRVSESPRHTPTQKYTEYLPRGYTEQLDEWRDYACERNYFPFLPVEKLLLPDESSLEHRRNIVHDHLYRAIKRKLWSGRRDDPKVRIELNI